MVQFFGAKIVIGAITKAKQYSKDWKETMKECDASRRFDTEAYKSTEDSAADAEFDRTVKEIVNWIADVEPAVEEESFGLEK